MTELRPSHTRDVALHLLVLRCQAGDDRAFAVLVDRFGPKTLAYLRSLVGQDADDVQQEVWLTVYRSLHSVADPGAFRTWLFRTTRHRAIDWLRRRRREAELWDDVSVDDIVDAHPDAAAADVDSAVVDRAVVQLARAARVGAVQWTGVVSAAMPFVIALTVLSVLIATLTTIGMFMRSRAATLNEIQLRLAALEEMIVSRADVRP